MLVKLAAPYQPRQGMDAAAEIVRPGGAPPFVSPHCFRCRVPVETFTLDPISSPYYLGIDATCHGQTAGKRLSVDEVTHKRRTGGVVWMFTE